MMRRLWADSLSTAALPLLVVTCKGLFHHCIGLRPSEVSKSAATVWRKAGVRSLRVFGSCCRRACDSHVTRSETNDGWTRVLNPMDAQQGSQSISAA